MRKDIVFIMGENFMIALEIKRLWTIKVHKMFCSVTNIN